MAVQLGDKIAQIGSGAYKLVDAHDINVHQATDGTGDGTMATTDLLICDTDAAGDVKKILISQLPFQPVDAELTAIAGLTYSAASYIRMTGAATFDLRTYANVLSDLSLDSELTSLTTAEIQQLQNIGATTISANQWAALGGIAETLTATELNYLDLTTLGTAQASKALTIAAGSTWTVAGMTCADLGIVTTVDINGGTINGITSLAVANSVDIGNFTLTANGLTIDGTFTDGVMSIASGNLSSVGTVGCGAITSTGLLGVSVAGNAAILQNTTDAASSQVAQFKAGNRVTAANDDEGYISLYCDNDAGTQVEMARLKWIITQVDAASEEGALDIQLESSGGGDLQSILYLSHANSYALFDADVKVHQLWAKDPTTGHYLKIQATANGYSADRILNLDTNDGDASVTFSYHPLLFDQPLALANSPTFAGLTLTGNLIIPNDGYIGSDDEDAIQIKADGDVVLTQDLYLTSATDPMILFGSSSLAKMWCHSDGLIYIRNTNYVNGVAGYGVNIGGHNKDNALKTILFDPDIPSFAPGNVDGAIDLGKSDRQWKDLYAVSGTLSGNLLVNGGDIGITGDTDLLQLAANALTVNGAITSTGEIKASYAHSKIIAYGSGNPQIRAESTGGSVYMKMQAVGGFGGLFGSESNHDCYIYTNNLARVKITSAGDVDVVNNLTAGTIQADDGFTGSWLNNEGDTVTVVGGIITDVSAP